jgi:hypothetical protein
MPVGISIPEAGIAIITAKAGFGPDEESAVRLQLMPPVINRVKPRDVTAQRHGQRPGQEAGKVHLARAVRVVEGREYEVGDWHAIDVVAIDDAGIAYFDQVVNLLTGGVRIEVRGLGDAGARRVNQHLQQFVAERDAQLVAIDRLGGHLPLVVGMHTGLSS